MNYVSISIIGCGVSGMIFALALSNLCKEKIKIDIIDSLSPPEKNSKHPIFDNRAIFLTKKTSFWLSSIGIWSHLLPFSAAISKIEISEMHSLGKMEIFSSDYWMSEFGYVIKMKDLGTKLFKLLEIIPGVQLHCPISIKSFHRERSENILILEDGKKIRSQLTILANGSLPEIAKKCGIFFLKKNINK